MKHETKARELCQRYCEYSIQKHLVSTSYVPETNRKGLRLVSHQRGAVNSSYEKRRDPEKRQLNKTINLVE